MDDALRRLADIPIPAALAQIDAGVLSALHRRQGEAQLTRRMVSLAALFAVAIGFAGNSVLPTPGGAGQDNPVLVSSSLAPSTLLDPL